MKTKRSKGQQLLSVLDLQIDIAEKLVGKTDKLSISKLKTAEGTIHSILKELYND